MGIESFIKKMSKKQKKLFSNILSILMILIVLISVISLVLNYNLDVLKFLASGEFAGAFVGLLFIYLAYSLLSKGKLNIPNTFDSKDKKKTQFNIPDTYGVRGNLKKPKKQQEQQPQKSFGTWTCPKCDYLAKGAKCNKCGYIRQD